MKTNNVNQSRQRRRAAPVADAMSDFEGSLPLKTRLGLREMERLQAELREASRQAHINIQRVYSYAASKGCSD